MRILFMGTPDFALFSLRALVEAGEEVTAVVTQPDKPKGRGYVLTPPPVKVFARAQGIPVLQPATLRGEEFADTLRTLDPELIVVVAFGKILPANVLEYPVHGCINVHGSLLPAYRGAAPMQRAILDGLSETGITTMRMDVGLDTGDMLLKRALPITEDDNFETVHDKLGEAGASLLLETIDQLRAGTLTPEVQDESLATYAAKIEKTDCLINFGRPAKAVHNQIRALSPFPLALTHTPDGKMLKLVSAKPVTCTHSAAPGTVLSLQNGSITVACASDAISILSVLPEGKKRMDAADFINGRKIAVGEILS